jgi:serine/threonine protein kinase
MSDLPIPTVGDVIAQKYQLIEKLGQGGFGVIFRAHRQEQPHEVALKILVDLNQRFDDHEMEQRFRREALMAHSLRHPHTVAQYEFGRTDVGYRFIAMEFLKGQNLTERIMEQGALSIPLILRISRAVLEVLDLAHSLDIVHRDLKPDNIMLCTVHGQSDFPKVLDFGAAKSMEGAHDITSAGMTLGSPAYMAPEVLIGQSPVPASDLYSLGLTIAETILAQKLVQGGNPLDRARAQISPQPIPIPGALLEHPLYPWLARAIDKDLSRRYRSAREMLEALNHHAAPLMQATPQEQEYVDATQEMQAINIPEPIISDEATEALVVPDAIRRIREMNRRQAAQASSFVSEEEEATQAISRVSVDAPDTAPLQAVEPELSTGTLPRREFGKSTREGLSTPREEDISRQLIPSITTDYQLLKTSEPKKFDWYTIQLLVGGAAAILFLYFGLRLVLG